MARRFILWLSVLANIALAVALFVSLRSTVPPSGLPASTTQLQSAFVTNVSKTNLVIRRQFFSWRELESDDYVTYVANLRGIGCPESTIRDIILADVNGLYAQKIATEVVTADQQWWRTKPDPELEKAAIEKLRKLDSERRQLLATLLGPGWDRSTTNLLVSLPAADPQSGVALTGPILGALAPETKQLVQNITAQAAERLRDYTDRMQAENKTPDPAELARLRQQTRNELARVLTPTQLEEYLLRYSQNGVQLRDQFSRFNLSPDEFRSVFHAVDQLDQQVQLLASAGDPASAQRQAELERQRDQAIKQALGPERYQMYQVSRDPAFQQAQTAAQAVGISPEATYGLYKINQAVEEERRRINLDPSLTTSDRIEQLQQVNAEHEKSLLALFGENAYLRYRQGTNAPASR